MTKDLKSYRRVVLVSKSPPLNLSLIEISPARPKQTLVFLHGLGEDATRWRAQLENFGRDNRVIAIDLRGHGQSDPPASAFGREKSAADIQTAISHHKSRQASVGVGYTRWPINRISHNWKKDATRELAGSPRPSLSMEVLLADLESIMKKLNVKVPFVLVGHSLGGALAAEHAKTYPYRIHRLVLLSTPPKFRLNASTAFMLGAPSWLSSLAHLWLGMPRALIQEFHNRILKYWIGSTTFKNLYVPTLFLRGLSRYYESSGLGDLKSKMPSAKEVFAPRSGPELNQVIHKFITTS